MKMTERLSELRSLDTDELGVRLKQARRELYELRFKLAVGQLENNREIRKARKDIARILTVMHQSRFEEGAPAESGTGAQTLVAVADVPESGEEQEELAGAEAQVSEAAPKTAETADEEKGQKSEEEGETKE